MFTKQQIYRSALVTFIAGVLLIGVGLYFSKEYVLLKVKPSVETEALVYDIAKMKYGLRERYAPVLIFKDERGNSLKIVNWSESTTVKDSIPVSSVVLIKYLPQNPSVVLSEKGESVKLTTLVFIGGIGFLLILEALRILIFSGRFPKKDTTSQ